MICSRDKAESGLFQKVCAWDPDVNESTLCTWEECEQNCAGTDWCGAFSISDYTGKKGAGDAKEQCWLFEKCFTMDDHDAYMTWPPSCVETDPEKTGRARMGYDAPRGIQYYDVDDQDEGEEKEDEPITVGGTAAGLIVGIVAAAVVCLICVVIVLVFYVRRLRKQIEEGKKQNAANVAIGRPVVQTSDTPAGSVVGGVPVIDAGANENPANDKGQKVEP